ncbi:MAG: hypothetical protein HFH45_01340 [Bacilli bacterium]|jgi:hypothetical protein|nr:hypothetical protein [Bacilli bacterium]
MIEITNGVTKVKVPKGDLDSFLKLGYKTIKIKKTESKPKEEKPKVNGKNTTKCNTK